MSTAPSIEISRVTIPLSYFSHITILLVFLSDRIFHIWEITIVSHARKTFPDMLFYYTKEGKVLIPKQLFWTNLFLKHSLIAEDGVFFL